MDYSKSGGPKLRKDAPRHIERNQKGQPDNPFGDAAGTGKAALLARMKAAAAARRDADDAAKG